MFVLNQANFYVNFDLMDFEPADELSISQETRESLKRDNKSFYPEFFK